MPFYFCPRSVMLYLIHKANHPELDYHGGQGAILHLESDLNTVIAWAEQQERRWAFTLSNAGSNYFEDRCDLSQLHEVDWDAVHARNWQGRTDGKQAEFLVEHSFPLSLVQRIGVCTMHVQEQVRGIIRTTEHRPSVEIKPEWYY